MINYLTWIIAYILGMLVMGFGMTIMPIPTSIENSIVQVALLLVAGIVGSVIGLVLLAVIL